MIKTGLIVAFLVALTAPTLFAAPSIMQEGKWEVSMKMELEGAHFPVPPMVSTQCITKEDLKDPNKMLPSSSNKKNDCIVMDYLVKGSTVTWKMHCKDGSTGSGDLLYKGKTSYSGTLTIEPVDKTHRTSKMVQHISGKRIGDCK